MGLSRSARIGLLLAIDVVFFFIELIAGYAVGSLALVADSFHMLNDVMSLVVALYAIKMSSESSDSRYSYGWHRAEILAALINGVFLLALCFSIFMEAMERFFSTPDISNPKLIVIVGSFGLASNIVGLFLFHEHSHSHSHAHGHSHAKTSGTVTPRTPSSTSSIKATSPRIQAHHSHHSRSDSVTSLYGHPAATRASLVQTAQELASGQSNPSSSARRSRKSGDYYRTSTDGNVQPIRESTEVTPLLEDASSMSVTQAPGETVIEEEAESYSSIKPHSRVHSHGHSHSGSMNMHAVLLHVLGDALGNVGVIATGLVIWLTEWKFKFYFDPVISLVITVIIFSSALPLVRSASFILLQGVPPTVSLDDVRADILSVEGVINLHELHIWQLSETKIVASVHVTASRGHDFMPVAAQIRSILHHHGIHSSTIQPEYSDPQDTLVKNDSCLILCPPDQNCNPSENSCCPPPPTTV